MGMKAFLTSFAILLALMAATLERGLGIEKVRLGPAVKIASYYNLPYLAADEKGLWKESGLAAELILFASAATLNRAMAAGHVEAGLTPSAAAIAGAAAGVPGVIVTHIVTRGAGFHLWVMANSPIKEVKDLKGGRMAVAALGSASHGYARIVARAYGLEKDVKYVGAGGPPEAVAALKARIVDAVMFTLSPLANLMAAGEVRKVLSDVDYLPRPWVEHVVMVRKDFLDSKPEVVRKVAKILFEGAKFVRENRGWAIEKLKGMEFGLSDKAAGIVYDNMLANLEYGKIDREGLENVRKFVVEHALVPKEKLPATDSIYKNIYD